VVSRERRSGPRRPPPAIARLAASALAVAVLLAWPVAHEVRAADPSSTPGAGGDPRSSGEGPGFVGDPLLAISGVVVVGVGSVLLTLAYVRLTERPRS